MKIVVKHINDSNVEEVEKLVKGKGLKPFHSLSFQFSQIPEGEYQIDTDHIFSNQYNTIGKNGHSGYRIFEYCRIYKNDSTSLRNYGYYIAEGIEEIREHQKRVSVCNYCGKQYIDTKEEICNACRDSEYLEKDNYHLLRLTNVCETYSNEPLPPEIVKDIKEKQITANLIREKKNQREALARLQDEIKDKKLEHKVRKALFENGFSYKEVGNLIYYSHTKTFCFGWRESVKDKEGLENRLSKIDLFNNLKVEIK